MSAKLSDKKEDHSLIFALHGKLRSEIAYLGGKIEVKQSRPQARLEASMAAMLVCFAAVDVFNTHLLGSSNGGAPFI